MSRVSDLWFEIATRPSPVSVGVRMSLEEVFGWQHAQILEAALVDACPGWYEFYVEGMAPLGGRSDPSRVMRELASPRHIAAVRRLYGMAPPRLGEHAHPGERWSEERRGYARIPIAAPGEIVLPPLARIVRAMAEECRAAESRWPLGPGSW